MLCTIYTTDELKRKRRVSKDRVLVLARYGDGLILRRDEINALWVLPEQTLQRGESAEETARGALGEALGEAVFDIRPLCAFTVTDEAGKEAGGLAYTADVREWPDERASHARAFTRLPLGSQVGQAALVFALHRWAGERFDERLTLERLGRLKP